MVLVNKLILSTYQFNYPNVLLMDQCITSLVLIGASSALGFATVEPMESRKALTWLPLNLMFLAMLITGFYSLKYLSVPMVLVFKNSSNCLVSLGDYVLYSQPISRLVQASLAVLVLASVLAASEDLEFTHRGYTWSVLNMVASTTYLLYLRHVMKSLQLSKLGMSYYNNMLGVPIVVALDLLTTNDLASFARSQQSETWTIDYGFVLLFISSGVVGLALNLASYLCLATTSPTTYSMVGALNKVPLAFIGTYAFHTKLTFLGSVYVGLSMAAGTLYAFAKAREQQQKL
jgi:GDP-mannose transporter